MIPVAGQAVPPAAEDTWRGVMAPPSSPPAPRPKGEFRRDVRRVVRLALREPFSRRARREFLYAGLSVLLAIPFFAFAVTAVTLGLGLSFSFAGMLVGLPLLVVSLLTIRRLGAICRRLADRVLGLRVPPPPPFRPRPGVRGWVWSGLTDPINWRAFGYLLLKLPIAIFAVAIACWLVLGTGLPDLLFPLWLEAIRQLAVHGVVLQVPRWLAWWSSDPVKLATQIRSLPTSFILVPFGAAAILGSPWAVRGVNRWDRALITRLLGQPLTQRVRDLEKTRASAVDDSAAKLRRIERDLHDGAQAQMVAVAMKLGLAKEKLGGPADGPAQDGIARADLERALELVDAAHRSAKEAIVELRDLARGIHPPVLDHGLGTALETLAARSGLPVEVVADLSERPSAAIETIAYFCAAELLANVAKHSGARHATLEAVCVPGLLRVRVSDDGTGGARVKPDSGLAGLAERLRTVDGTMEISSPRGGPTVVTVEMPSHA